MLYLLAISLVAPSFPRLFSVDIPNAFRRAGTEVWLFTTTATARVLHRSTAEQRDSSRAAHRLRSSATLFHLKTHPEALKTDFATVLYSTGHDPSMAFQRSILVLLLISSKIHQSHVHYCTVFYRTQREYFSISAKDDTISKELQELDVAQDVIIYPAVRRTCQPRSNRYTADTLPTSVKRHLRV